METKGELWTTVPYECSGIWFLTHAGEEYNPCSFSKVMQTLDELHKQLDEVKHQLNESSSK